MEEIEGGGSLAAVRQRQQPSDVAESDSQSLIACQACQTSSLFKVRTTSVMKTRKQTPLCYLLTYQVTVHKARPF